VADRPPAAVHQPDAVDLLLEQHAHIEELFLEVLATTGERRRRSFDALVRLLVMHETVEEEVIHPTARVLIDEGRSVVDARLAEENVAKRMLQDLVELDVDSEAFDTLLVSLRAEVLTHARHEERYEFGHLRRELSFDQLRHMADAIVMAAAVVPSRPHPGASASGEVPAGASPLVVANHIRDALGR
jgi:hypothetical protein